MSDVILPHTSIIQNDAIRDNFEEVEHEYNSFTVAAYREKAQAVIATGYTALKPDTLDGPDKDKCFDLVHGFYTVPIDGWYQIDGAYQVSGVTAKAYILACVFLTGVEKIRGQRMITPEAGICGVVVGGKVFCKQGQKLEPFVFNTGAAAAFEVSAGGLYLNRFMISRVSG